MSGKSQAKGQNQKQVVRVEGQASIARLQELLRREPGLKLEIVAPRAGSPQFKEMK